MKVIPYLFIPLLTLVSLSANAAANGKQLYDRHCAACHGLSGAGGVGIPLSLPSFLATVPKDYLTKTIRFGRPGRIMPAFAQLPDSEVNAIADYILSWHKGTRVTLSKAPVKGDSKNGAKLFKQHCANCHGVNGEGGKGTGVTFSRPRELSIMPPALLNDGFLKSASDQLIKTTLMKGRDGTPMESFIKKGLTEQEINDLVAYVRNFEQLIKFLPSTREDEVLPPILSYTSSSTFEETVDNIKQAIVDGNFRLIRVQNIDSGLSKESNEDNRKVIIYFCNFNIINELLKLDPRVGMFLPCRVTVTETDGKVQIMSINPKIINQRFNNDDLASICDLMYKMYREILEDSVL